MTLDLGTKMSHAVWPKENKELLKKKKKDTRASVKVYWQAKSGTI